MKVDTLSPNGGGGLTLSPNLGWHYIPKSTGGTPSPTFCGGAHSIPKVGGGHSIPKNIFCFFCVLMCMDAIKFNFADISVVNLALNEKFLNYQF